MSFTVDQLAKELGIDPATLAARGDVVAKWNGYLTEADTKYQTATQAQKDAQEKLDAAKREQDAINEQISKFGVTEVSLNELRASNAAYAAAFEEAKKGGFTVNMPTLPVTKVDPVDPNKALTDRVSQGFSLFGKALKVQNKYQAIFGKPFSDDIEALANEANSQRMDVYDYAAKKYDFAGEETRRSAAASAAHDAKVGADAIKKYQEEHPIRPEMEQRGLASRSPQVYKPRDEASAKAFRNLPVKERLAQSVARGRALAASQDVA